MQPSRMALVDALRGFALMGLFLVHCIELFELYWAHPKPGPVVDWVFGLFAGKSFALFALCFGLSFFILMDRAARRGVDFSGRFVWRLTLLFLIGVAHSLLYRGDILEVLGLLGIPLVLFNRIQSRRVLLALAAFFLLQPALIVRALAASGGAAWASQPPLFDGDLGLSTLTHGTFAQAIDANLVGGHVSKWSYYIESGRVSEIVGLYLFGLVLGRTGFFADPERFLKARRIWLAASIVLFLALTWAKPPLLALIPKAPAGVRSNVGFMLDTWTQLALLGVEALLFLEAWRTPVRVLLQPLAAAGRMTLTLYVGESLVFVPVLYGFGLGLHATLTPAQSLVIGLVSFAIQVAVANLWFRWFNYGPLEWAWRAATYLNRDIPFVRRPSSAKDQPAAA
jgi:uncharacterized protein